MKKKFFFQPVLGKKTSLYQLDSFFLNPTWILYNFQQKNEVKNSAFFSPIDYFCSFISQNKKKWGLEIMQPYYGYLLKNSFSIEAPFLNFFLAFNCLLASRRRFLYKNQHFLDLIESQMPIEDKTSEINELHHSSFLEKYKKTNKHRKLFSVLDLENIKKINSFSTKEVIRKSQWRFWYFQQMLGLVSLLDLFDLSWGLRSYCNWSSKLYFKLIKKNKFLALKKQPKRILINSSYSLLEKTRSFFYKKKQKTNLLSLFYKKTINLFEKYYLVQEFKLIWFLRWAFVLDLRLVRNILDNSRRFLIIC